MKVKITYEQFKEIFKSRKNELTLTKHLAIELFKDPSHPISEVNDFELRNHLFKYIDIIANKATH